MLSNAEQWPTLCPTCLEDCGETPDDCAQLMRLRRRNEYVWRLTDECARLRALARRYLRECRLAAARECVAQVVAYRDEVRKLKGAK